MVFAKAVSRLRKLTSRQAKTKTDESQESSDKNQQVEFAVSQNESSGDEQPRASTSKQKRSKNVLLVRWKKRLPLQMQ